MTGSRWRSLLGYGLLAAAVLACLQLVSLAPLALDWGRELIGAAIAIVAMVIGLKLARRPTRSVDAVPLVPAAEFEPKATTIAALPAATSPLSPRESAVLRQLCAGQSNKQIARTLNLSENTVKTHLANVYAKLGVGSRTAAQAAAMRLRLLDDARADP